MNNLFKIKSIAFLLLFSFCSLNPLWAQLPSPNFIVGDALPNAPELAPRGKYAVGVRTIEVVNKNQVDVLNSKAGVDPLYDRSLTLEVWYPAVIPAGQKALETYKSTLGLFNDPKRPLIPYTYLGRALREAQPDRSEGKYPLVIVSHGYPGSR